MRTAHPAGRPLEAGILLVAIGLGLIAPPIAAQARRAPRADPAGAGAVVWISPSRARPAVGGKFHLDVRIRGAEGIASVPFTLLFDPAAIEFVEGSGREGSFLRRDGAPTVFLATGSPAGGGAGRVTVGLSRIGGTGGAVGRGLICRLTFRAKRAGPTTVSFSRARLLDPEASPQPARFEGITLNPGARR